MALNYLIPILVGAFALFITSGLGVYILNAFADAFPDSNVANLIRTLANALGNWATTWIPILLVIVIAISIMYLLFATGQLANQGYGR